MGQFGRSLLLLLHLSIMHTKDCNMYPQLKSQRKVTFNLLIRQEVEMSVLYLYNYAQKNINKDYKDENKLDQVA